MRSTTQCKAQKKTWLIISYNMIVLHYMPRHQPSLISVVNLFNVSKVYLIIIYRDSANPSHLIKELHLLALD